MADLIQLFGQTRVTDAARQRMSRALRANGIATSPDLTHATRDTVVTLARDTVRGAAAAPPSPDVRPAATAVARTSSDDVAAPPSVASQMSREGARGFVADYFSDIGCAFWPTGAQILDLEIAVRRAELSEKARRTYLCRLADRFLEDDVLTPQEEVSLLATAEALGLDEQQLAKAFRRHRGRLQVARIAGGQLPTLPREDSPVPLARDEVLHMVCGARYTSTEVVSYRQGRSSGSISMPLGFGFRHSSGRRYRSQTVKRPVRVKGARDELIITSFRAAFFGDVLADLPWDALYKVDQQRDETVFYTRGAGQMRFIVDWAERDLAFAVINEAFWRRRG